MSFRNIVIIISCFAFFSCNSEKKETPGSVNIPSDLVRDGLVGNVMQYSHKEFTAKLDGSNWIPANDTAIAWSVYTYDTKGNLKEAADKIINGQPAATKRVYKESKDKPTVIIRYEGTNAVNRTERNWNGTSGYTEKTYSNFEKTDTTNWESLQGITLNQNHLMEKSVYTMRTGGTSFTATSYTQYNTDNSVRSRSIISSGADTTVINYTILSKDQKGNPTHILKQYPATGQNTLVVKSYEYYKI